MDKQILGKAETIALPELGVDATHARVDTGAKTSAIWVDSVEEVADGLAVVFFGDGSSNYDGKSHKFTSYTETVVASSNGAIERRYKVRLLVVVGGRRIRAWFTLADRAAQVYPVLIGRNVLRGKFLVDVSKGTEALRDHEQERTKTLRKAVGKQ